MGCCSTSEQGKSILVASDDRRCTDCIILIPYMLTLSAMMVVAAVSFVGGNPDRLIYPTDYIGQYCGKPGTSVAFMPRGFYRKSLRPTRTGELHGVRNREVHGF